jgi:lipoprotein signal peptidase
MTVPKRFGVLRFIAVVLKVIAWIFLVIAILAGIAAALSQFTGFVQTPSTVDIPLIGPLFNILGASAAGIIFGIAATISGLLTFILWYAAAEMISLYLAVEENSRLTAALLLRMHQESQPDTRAGYTSAYPSEPFEG